MGRRVTLFMFACFVSVWVVYIVSYNNPMKTHWKRTKDYVESGSSQSFSNDSLDSFDNFRGRLELRMENRRRQVQDICNKFGFHHDKNKIRNSMIYSTKYKTIFCQIPKTGITRWKQLFTDMNSEHFDDLQFTSMFKDKFQLNGEEGQELLLKDDWLKMTVVREPMERLLSAFRSKLANPTPKLKSFAESIHFHYGNKSDSNYFTRDRPTFNTFINYLVLGYPNSLTEDNMHWEKYSSLCQPCDVKYDIIGHQDTVGEDSRYVLKTIGAPPDLELRSAYQNKTDDDMVLRYYSTVKPRERVMQLYNLLLDDYMLFGYPPPPLLKQLFNTT